MSSLFSPKIDKPKPDEETQRAQRRQARDINEQTAEEGKEIGARRRLVHNRRRAGRNLLARSNSSNNAATQRETFG